MLAAEGLLKALSEDDENKYEYDNNDFDVIEVLKFCSEPEGEHPIRYADGTERTFLFNK